MKKIISLFILIILYYNSKCQNLIPNPSFEYYRSFDTLYINVAYPWYSNNPTYSSVDYFNKNTPLPWWDGIPCNVWGYQYAHFGNAYAGFGCQLFVINTLREYLSVNLKDTLRANDTYELSFYLSFSNITRLAVNHIDAYFGYDNLLTNPNNNYVLNNYVPQIKHYNIVSDTLNWIKLTGTYKAIGGEKFITIGNFYPDDSLQYIIAGTSTENVSYYYIDDISLYETNSPVFVADAGNNITINEGDSVMLGSHNLPDYYYTWYPKTGLNDTTLANPTAKPHSTTTYYLKLADFKFDFTYDSVTVTVIPDNINDITYKPELKIPNYLGKNNQRFVIPNIPEKSSLKIYNYLGINILETDNYQNNFDFSAYSNGTYFYVLQTQNKYIYRGKIVLLK